MSGWAWVRVGAVLGFLAVALGAFGAHGLRDKLEALGTSATYQTAVQYHMYHALALLAVGLMPGPFRSSGASTVAGWAFLSGVVVFSGSLYVLSLTGMKWLGAITPIGGVAMLVGWAALAVAASTFTYPAPEGFSSGSTAVAPDADLDAESAKELKLEHRP
jgi:uncharacterized membrane protein YgdD (TMEM256/DUF423 family)